MLTTFQWVLLAGILLVAMAGGYLPLFKSDQAREREGFPLGQAFASGVFLALCLTIMLPAAFQLFEKALPQLDYPIESAIAIAAFLLLLALEHMAGHLLSSAAESGSESRTPAIIPIIMTVMIAIPSFFLGTALAVSDTGAAVLIFIAIVAHKGSAAFALALKMVRSTLSRPQIFLTFGLFAFSTPLGILVGGDLRDHLAGPVVVIFKGVILSLAAGTFLYLGTLHEMKHASLIQHCARRNGFLAMVAGLVLTALVRLLLGEAHHP